MNLTERDISVVDFINTYKAATTKMLVDLVYSNYNVGTRRLKMLVDEGYLKRSRIATGEWLYHSDSDVMLLKNLIITKFAVSLMGRGITIGDVYYGKYIDDTLVDAQIIIRYKDKEYMLLIESEIIGSFNRYKYDKLYENNKTIKGYTPVVVVIDNKPVDTEAPYPVVRLNRDISNIDSLLSKLEGLQC